MIIGKKTIVVNSRAFTKLLVLMALCLFFNEAFSQYRNPYSSYTRRSGFITGYSAQQISDQIGFDVKYQYKTVYFQYQYYRKLAGGRTWNIDLLFQPQVNVSRYRWRYYIVEDLISIEAGVNVGILLRKNLFRDYCSVYFLPGIGPHYISGAPVRQNNGFNFSDNLLAGINVKLAPKIYLDFRTGVRHISNAHLFPPNGGLNAVVISGGIMIFTRDPRRRLPDSVW